MVINHHSLLPLKDKALRYFILTPWGEQANGIARVMAQEGYQNVVAAKETELSDAQSQGTYCRLRRVLARNPLNPLYAG